MSTQVKKVKMGSSAKGRWSRAAAQARTERDGMLQDALWKDCPVTAAADGLGTHASCRERPSPSTRTAARETTSV
jgi:hypothetical protein